ncbi:MAG: hypothetical protein WC400_01080 [Patescibacteria group bacterium]|jgi:hypothetical protein
MEYQPLPSQSGDHLGKEAPHHQPGAIPDWDRIEASEDRCIETRRVTITEQHCIGHFEGEAENTPKIMPLYKLLRNFIEVTAMSSNRMDGYTNYQLPEAVTINVGSALPMGVECEERIFPIDVFENSTEYAIWRANAPAEKDQIRFSAQLGMFNKDLFSSQPRAQVGEQLFPIHPETVLKDHAEIAQILPHGPEIVMIDGIISPKDPGVIMESFHQVTTQDFLSLNLPFGGGEFAKENPVAMFDIASTLEGLGQTGYIYFQEVRPGQTIPVFTKIEATLNHQHQPNVGDIIYYQLTSFERTGSKGSISGQVLANDHKTVISQFNISARLMARGLLMGYIKEMKKQPATKPADQPTQDKA